jgi:hypothetical protein
MRRAIACAIFTVALGVWAVVAWVGATPAGATAAPVQQGWWTALNPGPLPELGQPVPAPTPPDVPAQGLLVQGGTSGSPVAYAGLVYDLPIGATASTLTLTIAPNSVTTPDATLELCPLVNPVLNPEQGGPSSDAPAYSCTNSVSAVPNSQGSAYQFNVSGLVTEGTLAVAILPVSATDRVVFSQPGDASLDVQLGAAGQSTQAPILSSGVAPNPGFATPQYVPTPLSAAAGEPPAPGSNAPTTTAPAPTEAQSSPRATNPIPVFALSSDNASPLAVALVVAGLSGGAVLWFSTGRRRPGEDEVPL